MYLFLRTYQYNIELIFSIKNRITAKTISLFSRNTVSIMDKVYHSVSIAVSAAAFRVQDCCVGAAAFRVQDCCVGAAVSEFKISVSALLPSEFQLLSSARFIIMKSQMMTNKTNNEKNTYQMLSSNNDRCHTRPMSLCYRCEYV